MYLAKVAISRSTAAFAHSRSAAMIISDSFWLSDWDQAWLLNLGMRANANTRKNDVFLKSSAGSMTEQVRTASESLTRVYNHATFKNIGDGHTIADRSEHVREDGFLNFAFPRGEDDDSPKQLTEPRATQHRTFEQVLSIDGPGSSVAELPLFDGGNYPASVAAVNDATLLFASKQDFQELCLTHPQLALKRSEFSGIGGNIPR